MQWINFLHLYQPANTKDYYIQEAVEKSYSRILRALEENPEARFTLNINGCLILRLCDMGYEWLVKRFRDLYEKGQIEIVSTAAYHPVLPLLPKREIIKQIKEQEGILKEKLGVKKRPSGFFLPEMAFSPEIAKTLVGLKYKWIILDEIAYNGKLDQVDFAKVYQDKDSGLKVVFRSRRFSNTYIPEKLRMELESDSQSPDLVVTASDAELYGLRHEDPTGEFENILRQEGLELKTISEHIAGRETVKIKPLACSWESMPKELLDNQPYVLWKGRHNKIHELLWKLADLTLVTVWENQSDPQYYWARWHMVRGLASCTFWWAASRDFNHNFGPYAWNPDEIERGLEEFIRAIRSIENSNTRKTKLKAEKIFIKTKELIWKRHWLHYWKK